MKLPNGHRAIVHTKLEEYVLNPLHRHGRHKARVFESVLGILPHGAHVLRDALLHAAATSEEAEGRGDNGFGDVYVLRFPISTERNSAVVTSVWIVRHGEDCPRLTTCYI